MAYQFRAQLGPDCLLMQAENGAAAVWDRIPFVLPPKENYRYELQKELVEKLKNLPSPELPFLITYTGVEVYQGELYLVRANSLADPLVRFSSNNLETTCTALQNVLQWLAEYQQSGQVLSGISPGLLRVSAAGDVYLLDPQVWNDLSKALPEEYQVTPVPEKILGRSLNGKADGFAWGVLAYYLLSGGNDPFAANNPEERIDKIVRTGVLPLRDLRPEVSEALNQLVLAALTADPARRLSIPALRERFAELLTNGRFQANELEVREYRQRSVVNQQRFQRKERMHFWLRKYGLVACISLVCLIMVLMIFRPRAPEYLTKKTTPIGTVNLYFRGLREINVVMVDETLRKAPNSFTDLVTNLHVMNKTQQGYVSNTDSNAKVTVDLETVRPITQSHEEAKFQLKYRLKVSLPTFIQTVDRTDRFTLRKIKDYWRITDIKVLKQTERKEKVKAKPVDAPAVPPQLNPIP